MWSNLITLSSNASRVPFEYLQYYLNKERKSLQSKARVNESIINQIYCSSFKKVSKKFSMQVSEDFSKKCNYLFDLTNLLVAL